jgi:hypothetical protein
MLLQWSGIGIVAGSGKLNGTVLAKNKGGSYARTKVTPTNPQTTAQQNARNILSTQSQAWGGLTQVQRDGWNNAAPSFPYTDRFGNSKNLSGQTLFVKLNANLNYADVAAIDDVPAPVAIPAITALTIAGATSTTLSITFAPTPVPAGFALILRLTPNIKPGREFVKNQFRNVAVVAAAGTSPHNTFAAYEALFGPPVTGSKIFVQAFYISTDSGQSGIPLQAQIIVT